MRISGVIPAAGRSQRMGTSKLLLPLAGTPLLVRVVDAVLGGGVEELVVVVGPEAAEIKAALAGRPIHWAVNPTRESDMLSSIRCGIRSASAASDGLLVTPGDLAHLQAPLVSMLIQAFQAAGRGIVVPVYHGRRGHPLIFSSQYREAVLTRYDLLGLRGLLLDHATAVREVPVATGAVLADIDTPEDYERARQELRTASAPVRKNCAAHRQATPETNGLERGTPRASSPPGQDTGTPGPAGHSNH